MKDYDSEVCGSIDRRTWRALTVLAHDEMPVDDAETPVDRFVGARDRATLESVITTHTN